MKNYTRILLHGIVIWIVPFVFAFFFFDKQGNILINRTTFSVIITLVLIATACISLVKYFKAVKADYVKQGIFYGVGVFVINAVLDSIVLVGFLNVTTYEYVAWTLPVYVNIPIIALAAGKLLEKKATR